MPADDRRTYPMGYSHNSSKKKLKIDKNWNTKKCKFLNGFIWEEYQLPWNIRRIFQTYRFNVLCWIESNVTTKIVMWPCDRNTKYVKLIYFIFGAFCSVPRYWVGFVPFECMCIHEMFMHNCEVKLTTFLPSITRSHVKSHNMLVKSRMCIGWTEHFACPDVLFEYLRNTQYTTAQLCCCFWLNHFCS